MNAPFAIPDLASRPSPCDHATQAVAQWRGQLLQVFAEAETAVTRTLFQLTADPVCGKHVRRSLLVGARYDDLVAALRPTGPFAKLRSAVPSVAALEAFVGHHDLRHALCHAMFRVAVDSRGRWAAIADLTAFRSDEPLRKRYAYVEDEAEPLLGLVSADREALRRTLGQLRADLNVCPPAVSVVP